MYDTARRRRRKLSIQLGSLFSKETRAAKRLIDAGQLGRIYYAKSYGFRRRGPQTVEVDGRQRALVGTAGPEPPVTSASICA